MNIILGNILLLLGVSSVKACLEDYCSTPLDSNNSKALVYPSEHRMKIIESRKLASCLDDGENLEILNLSENVFTSLPEGLFDGMSSHIHIVVARL